MKKRFIKRCLMILLSIYICLFSVYVDYKSVKGADITAGIVAAIGGGPILTALLIGGVVIAGGITIEKILQSSPQDRANFVNGVKNGFEKFVQESEEAIILSGNANITESEAKLQASQEAARIVNEFTDKCINTASTTKSGLSKKTVTYWNEFCEEIRYCIDRNIGSDSGLVINPDTVLHPKVVNFSQYSGVSINAMETVGAKTYNLDGHYYYIIGDSPYNEDLNRGEFNQNGVPSDRVRLYFNCIFERGGAVQCVTYQIDINKLTLTIIACTSRMSVFFYNQGGTYTETDLINRVVANSSLPCFIFDNISDSNTFVNELQSDYQNVIDYLSVSNKTPVKPYQQDIIDSVTDTALGQSISTGRRAVVNGGDYVTTVFEDEGSLPIKKAGLRTDAESGTATGDLGWDIPSDEAWEGGISRPAEFPRVVDDTGTIVLPKDVTDEETVTGVIDWPIDDDVIDTSEDDPTPKPVDDVLESQGGNFYPVAMDLTNIFPFCIPFDIIYVVEKFDVGGENAPIITIPIVYPTAIQGAMGSTGYDVVIDFNDFIVLRNVLRVFLLLLFIAGLMKITRELIRG